MNRPGRSQARSLETDRREPHDTADLAEAVATVDTRELGDRLRKARAGKALTQGEVAEGVISTAYLSRIESGQRRPELKILRVLAERVGMSIHELLLGLTPRAWATVRVELDWVQLALRSGDIDKALTDSRRILEELPANSTLQRRASLVHALALEANGQYSDAAARLEDLADSASAATPTLDVLTALSRVYRQAGELSRAVAVGERASSQIADLGLDGTPEAVKVTLTVAAAHTEMGDLGYAARLCQKALDHARNDPMERAGCYWNASIIESRRGNHDEAVMLGQKALHILDDSESARNSARLRTQLGILHLRLKPPQIEEAMGHLRDAEKELVNSDASPADLAANRLAQARAHFLADRLHRAEREARSSLEHLAASAPIVSAEAHVLLGQIMFKKGSRDQAETHYREAILALSAIGADRAAAQVWFELGGLWLAIGCPAEALQAFESAGAATGLQPNPLVDHVATVTTGSTVQA